MLKQYSNIDQILNSKESLSAKRLPNVDYELLDYPDYRISYAPVLNTTSNQKTEFHIYSNNSWITGNHSIQSNNISPQIPNVTFPIPVLDINLYHEFESLGITGGNFRIVLNFFENLIGSYDNQYLKVSEISPDRTEIKLSLIDNTNQPALTQLVNFIDDVNQTQLNDNIINPNVTETYLLNFSQNNCIQFVNSVVVGSNLYVKLLKPLPVDIDLKFKCWVVQEKKLPYIDTVEITPESLLSTLTTLSGPNWQANTTAANISTETDLKSWNDLLGSSIQTSQQIIDSYFSGSLSGIDLNIDYSDFNNFIFYSSAAERLANFRYKLGLIETYTSQSIVISNINSAVSTTNANDYTQLKTNLISGFDEFENYLYYESSSLLFTHDQYNSYDVTVSELTGSYVQPAPKNNSTKPYSLMSITSSNFITWYDSLYTSASLYDSFNTNILTNGIPEFIRFDSDNSDMSVFVNMLGHHFDILYTYIRYLSKIYDRDEHPKRGVPNQLLYNVAKQFGWNLSEGSQGSDLWEYLFGTNEQGIPITGSLSVGDPAVSKRDTTYSVWRRIVNNLPLLLKSKGTKRSIRAMLSCYGIPQSLISINEYGGPRIERAPIYETQEFNYALDLINNAAGTVTVNYTKPIQAVELRFRTDNVLKNPSVPSTMNLFSIGGNDVTIDFNSGTLGTIRVNTTASGLIDCFDGEYLNTLLRSGSNGSLEILAQKSKYGKILSTVSASITGSFPNTGTLILGGTTGGSRLSGQLQELRFWSSSLNIAPFSNHTKAPGAYDGNVDTYEELVARFPLNEKVNHSVTSSLQGVEPNYSRISASFNGWSTAEPYNSQEETYYYDAISVGNDTLDDNKIRLEDNKLISTLSPDSRAEQSQYDKAPLDSAKLGIFYSPQTMINEDIIAQLGFVDLEDYIGDPADQDSKSYPALEKFSETYWKKYSDKNNINEFLRIFSLFDLSFFSQIEQLLPARVEKITGLLIQPNLLERSKDSTNTGYIEKFNETYNTTLIVSSDTKNITSSYHVIDSDLIINSETASVISAENIDNYTGFLTSSTSYTSTPYSYDIIYRYNGAWVTGSTPYWTSEATLPTITGSRISEIFKTMIKSSSNSPEGYGSGTYGSSTYGSDASSGVIRYFNLTGSFAEVQDFLPIGTANHRYNGCKLIGKDFNIEPSRFTGDFKTVDGGPVVEFTDVNSNQITISTPSNEGNFVVEKIRERKQRKKKRKSGEEPEEFFK